jgi:F0F1-type ATP synthase delta subunit
MAWSLFTEQLLKEIFHEFLPEKNVKTQTTESTVITTIPLGEDFDEHNY